MDDLTIGQRVARCRRARGMSQQVLAHLLGRSPSWVTKIERGERQLDRMSLIVEVARVLGVDVGEIAGQPYRPGAGEPADVAVSALRRVLLGYAPVDLDAAVAPGVDPLPVLEARLAGANRLRHDADYDRLGEVLPPLIEDLQVAVARLRGHDRECALWLLAEACHCARAMLKSAGYLDLAWIAAERGGQAARALGDPLLLAANAWSRVEVYAAVHAGQAALALALATIEELDRELGAAPPGQLSLVGILHLKAAWCSAASGDERQTQAHVDEAIRVAALMHGDRNDFGTLFGPTNLAIHRTGIAVELGKGAEALRHADAVDVRDIAPRERRARHSLDVAHAHAQLGRADVAVRWLVESERTAPDYLRNHPVAQEVVGRIMKRSRRGMSHELRALAQKVGVA
jgi:transcriptional regulator with XRE-family HTH domain